MGNDGKEDRGKEWTHEGKRGVCASVCVYLCVSLS